MELKLIPRISEKAYATGQNGVYIFDVPTTANKQQVANAVAKQYDVKVNTVNVVVAKGKVKKTYRKNGTPVTGRRSTVKKAYVRLAEGNTIALFDEEKK